MSTPTHLSAEQLAACQRLHDHLVETGPDRFDMGTWLEVGDAEYLLHEAQRFDASVFGTECGTRACLAGHAVVLFGDDELDAHRRQVEIPERDEDWGHIKWLRQTLTEDAIIDLLGINVMVPGNHTARDWFGNDWPAFAQQMCAAHYLKVSSAYGDRWTASKVSRHADHRTVVQVLDELVHGHRMHWWDADVLDEEELVASDDQWDPS